MRLKQNIEDYLSHASGDFGDICANVYYQFLKKENSDAVQNFRDFLEGINRITSDHTLPTKQYFSAEEYQKNYGRVGSMTRQLIDNLIKKNETPEVFYSELWNNITNSDFFSTEIEIICAILSVITSNKVPYFQLGEAVRMENDEFAEIAHEIDSDLQKAIFAINRGYEQRTEIASQLISVAKELKDEKKQLVFVANLIAYYNMRLEQLTDLLKTKNLDQAEENSKD